MQNIGAMKCIFKILAVDKLHNKCKMQQIENAFVGDLDQTRFIQVDKHRHWKSAFLCSRCNFIAVWIESITMEWLHGGDLSFKLVHESVQSSRSFIESQMDIL